MELSDLRLATLRQMSAAIRRGEAVHMGDLSGCPSGRIPLDELAPLCESVTDPALRPFLAPGAVTGHPAQVAALIPTHQRVPLGLRALQGQDVAVTVTILSNGPAGPRAVPGARVHRLPWRGHGATRQAGLALVDAPYVLLLTDDAIPLGQGFVRTLVVALEAGGWDAVMARQVPWPDADPVTRARLRRWTPPGRQVVATKQADNVATLYRTAVLRTHPIPDVPIAEDAWWSRGRRVGYVPTAAVLHSHVRRPKALYVRNRDIHAQLVRMGHPPSVPSLPSLLRALPGALRPVLRGQPYEGANQLAELLGQWRGAGRAM